ncbi:MAG TPA: HupE/UreJ family protein [Dongiaceae bacterium]|nr:HupE/UreJ family protein [Dongiaceae bacterium]
MKRFCFLLLLVFTCNAWAHQTSDSFLYLDTANGTGRLDLAIADLHRIVTLDADNDGQIRWQEVQEQGSHMQSYVQQHLQVDAEAEPCSLEWQTPALTLHGARHHLAFPFKTQCVSQSGWQLRYDVLFDRDALHRAFVRWQNANDGGLAVLSKDSSTYTLPDTSNAWDLFQDYFHQGVAHLLIGYDHILFLIALLLPVATRLVAPGATLRSALIDTLGIVTLFTLAHSLTLALSALAVVQLPATLIEVLIALSVSGAGVVALVPAWHSYRHLLAFGFGLVHGFGFANVLAELAPSLTHQVISLAAFNLGVEAGQALVVGMVLPLLYWGRHTLQRFSWSLPGGAWSIVACGLLWTWQRW